MAKVKSWTGVWITEPKVLGVFPRGDFHPHPPSRTDRTIIPKLRDKDAIKKQCTISSTKTMA